MSPMVLPLASLTDVTSSPPPTSLTSSRASAPAASNAWRLFPGVAHHGGGTGVPGHVALAGSAIAEIDVVADAERLERLELGVLGDP